jgi:ceramide glucosyltransferase
LFGVASADDPVCDVVRSVMQAYPQHAAQLVICSTGTGTNAKVAQLIQMERLAEHEAICISDADVWVAPGFLADAIGPLQDPAVGVVNCLYRLANTQSWAMRWEAVAVNADFWSQVLQSLSLQPMDFALGAAMFTTRTRLASIGGFFVLADQLADDYELGHRLARNGARIVLSPEVVECRSVRLSFREVWSHQLRWARTIRTCRPISAFLTILSNASLWPLLWVGFAPSLVSGLGAVGCLGFRLLNATCLERRLTGSATASSWGMPIIKDLLQVLLWALSFTGKEVTWRGNNYRVEEGGRLTPLLDEVK